MLTEEKINSNYLRWINALEKYRCCSNDMLDDIGDRLKNCTFSMYEYSGSAYKGAMIDVVLNILCPIAYRLNENGIGDSTKYIKSDNNSLFKVCLLQHIAKCDIFVEEQSPWKVKNGTLYTFNGELPTSMKCGERSVYLCMKYGIRLTEQEYEAMKVIDKDDDKTSIFSSPLAIIVKTANQLLAIELRQRWAANHKNIITEEK